MKINLGKLLRTAASYLLPIATDAIVKKITKKAARSAKAGDDILGR